MRLWVAASSTHQPLESLLLPKWGEGGQAKAGRQGCFESVNFLLHFSLLPEPEGGLTRLAGEPPVFGRVAGLLRRFAGCCAPGMELCWSLSGKGAHCSPQSLRRLLGVLPGSCRRVAESLASVLREPRPGPSNTSGLKEYPWTID